MRFPHIRFNKVNSSCKLIQTGIQKKEKRIRIYVHTVIKCVVLFKLSISNSKRTRERERQTDREREREYQNFVVATTSTDLNLLEGLLRYFLVCTAL